MDVVSGLDAFLDWVAGVPSGVLYLALGLAAALENIVPPIPADVVVLFGGTLSGRGAANTFLVFLAVWLCNVAGALLVYFAGRRFGTRFFAGRWGRVLLHSDQLVRIDLFYRRYGPTVIFVSRFLPMFRAVVPVFAGVAGLSFWRTAVPIAAASAIWYGTLVYVGAAAGRNWDELVALLESAGRPLWIIAAVLAVLAASWWWRTR